MKNSRNLNLKGIIPPVVTPFASKQGSGINEESLRKLLRFLLEEGVHGVFVCGGVGEGLLLHPEECEKVVRISVDEVNGKVPVLACVWDSSTDKALNTIKHLADYGADVALVIAPYYYRFSEDDIYEHFKTLGQEAEIPIMIYDLTRFCGYDVSPQVLLKLTEIDNIVGIKESVNDLKFIAETIHLCGNKLSIFAGAFDIFLPTLIFGGHGCITGWINCLPKLHVDLFESFQKGDLQKASELFYKIMPIWKFGANPVMVKEALNILGFSVGHPRRPSRPIKEEERMKLRKVLSDLSKDK